MTSRMRWARMALAVALVAAVASGCGSSDNSSTGADNTATGAAAAQKITPVRLSLGPWVGYGPFFIAKAKGFDKRHGVEFKTTLTTGGAQEQLSVFQGGADAGTFVTQNALAVQDKIPSTAVLFMDSSKSADAVLSKNIDSIAGLRGKKIGLDVGGADDLMLRGALKSAGLSPRDVKMLNIPGAGNSAALISGKVDAAVTYEPYVSNAVKRGAKVIYTAGQDPGIVSDITVVKPGFLKAHPDAVVGMLRAWDDGVRFYNSNRKEATEIIGKAIGADPKDLASQFTDEKLKIYSLAESNDFMKSQFQPLAQKLMDLQRQAGTLKTNVDVAHSFDLTPGQQAAGG